MSTVSVGVAASMSTGVMSTAMPADVVSSSVCTAVSASMPVADVMTEMAGAEKRHRGHAGEAEVQAEFVNVQFFHLPVEHLTLRGCSDLASFYSCQRTIA
jgi:hypothetical protein